MTESRPQIRIAVVIPNRNDAGYIRRCLESVLMQKDRPDEIIVVDDASTDDSVSVIRSTIQGHHNARLVVNPSNLGTNGALNEGLKEITSNYVLFLAPNDFVMPGIFAHARAAFAGRPDAGLWSALAWLVDEEDRPLRLHHSPVVSLRATFLEPERCRRLAIRFGNWFTGTSLIYRRDVLDETGGFDPAYGGLSDLFTALAIAAKRGALYCPSALAAIRIHKGSFLPATLRDVTRVEGIIERLSVMGARKWPELASTSFLRRTSARLRFACARAGNGANLDEVAKRCASPTRSLLSLVHRCVPKALIRGRLGLAFAVLRPFDIVPTVLFRGLSWFVVRTRARYNPDDR